MLRRLEDYRYGSIIYCNLDFSARRINKLSAMVVLNIDMDTQYCHYLLYRSEEEQDRSRSNGGDLGMR